MFSQDLVGVSLHGQKIALFAEAHELLVRSYTCRLKGVVPDLDPSLGD